VAFYLPALWLRRAKLASAYAIMETLGGSQPSRDGRAKRVGQMWGVLALAKLRGQQSWPTPHAITSSIGEATDGDVHDEAKGQHDA
jgi:hypothetical protein